MFFLKAIIAVTYGDYYGQDFKHILINFDSFVVD